jgi:hypothetical protein
VKFVHHRNARSTAAFRRQQQRINTIDKSQPLIINFFKKLHHPENIISQTINDSIEFDAIKSFGTELVGVDKKYTHLLQSLINQCQSGNKDSFNETHFFQLTTFRRVGWYSTPNIWQDC